MTIGVDWLKLKAEYITDEEMSYRKLAKKHGVSESTLYKRAKSESWHEAKLKHRQTTVAKAVAVVEKDQEKRLSRLLIVTDKLLDKIERLVENLSEGDLIVDKKGLKDLTGAIKDIKDIQSVKSKIDLQEQQARIDKLRKDAEKEEKDTEIKVVIGGDLEEYSK